MWFPRETAAWIMQMQTCNHKSMVEPNLDGMLSRRNGIKELNTINYETEPRTVTFTGKSCYCSRLTRSPTPLDDSDYR